MQSLGSTVGKRLFGTANSSVIQRKIKSLDKAALSSALKAQGIKGGMTARKIADVLTGKAVSGSTRHLGGTIRALQDLGVTVEKDARMGTIMAESTKRAQQDESYKATGSVRPSALNLGANASLGTRIAASRLASEGGEQSQKPVEHARSIKEIRETLRALGIRDPKLPRPGFGRADAPPPPAGR